jgi:hypothetical protein
VPKTEAAFAATAGPDRQPWEKPWVLGLLVIASAFPLLWPDIPPLTDLPGHIGRYRVQLDLATSPTLQQFYAFAWQPIGNLGVDLLVELLAPLLGLELAVKLIVLAIPPLTVAGLLWTAHEAHGRIPPTTLFALPLAFNFPFLYGFVNFALAMALALIAFALWLRLGRLGRLKLRALLFCPISILLWFVHAFGWGVLGLLAFSAELVRQMDGGRSFSRAAINAALHCLPMTPSIALMLLWRSDAAGGTGDWFNLRAKLNWILMMLRDRWAAFDVAALALLAGLLLWARRDLRLRFARNLAIPALLLAAVFLALPRILFGSAYADMRLAPFVLALALVAIRFPGDAGRLTRIVGLAGLAFFAARTGATTASMWLYDRTYDRELVALAQVPQGARVASFVGQPCGDVWAMSRTIHLPAFVIARREGFSNDQWMMAGAQLMHSRYHAAAPFEADPSQIVSRTECRRRGWRSLDQALAAFPRDAFDYLWLIDPPAYDARLTHGLDPVWRSGPSVLYRISRSTSAAAPRP